MKTRDCLLLFPLLFGVFLLPSAQAQTGPLDVSLNSCAAFLVLQSHMDAAYHTVTKGYRTVPGQSEPVAQVEGVENPEKLKEFMDWYANGGASDMAQQGSMCRFETINKSGEAAGLKTAFYVAEQRALNAEFFAGKLLKQCTGKSLK